MNIFALFETRVREALESLTRSGRLPEGLDLSRVVVEPPRDASHGDLATNAALVLAKEAKQNPKALGEALAEELRTDPRIVEASVAGPGFINLRLAPEVFQDVIRAALSEGENFGRGQMPGGPVNIEYVSANPTGPMHVGHGRGAVFGDALANLLAAAGRPVTREYYINDAGAQVDVLARSAYLRYREALGETITIPEGLYPGDYLKPVGMRLAETHGRTLLDQPEHEWLPQVRRFAIDAMMAMIREDLAAIGIRHDVFFSEATLQGENGGKVAELLDALRQKGLVYEGRLPPPKGQLPDDWEDREQTLFRSSQFGDDVDRALLKSDGSFTYFASDIAYHRDKWLRGANELIDVLGADHGGYVKRMQAAVKAVSDGQARLDVKLCQLVRLLRAGEPVKMSKRAGEFVTLRDVIDEVGRDAIRFMMLYRKNDATLDFDLAKVVEQSKDNPVFYVQYGHARRFSVLRQAREALPGEDFSPAALLADADLSVLTDPGEIEMMRLIAQYPRVLESAAAAHEPHRIAFYLYETASSLHSFWNKGKDLPQLRIVNPTDRNSTRARLALVEALGGVLASGLAVLGVSAPNEMR
ncbi:arginine--tRNA ligase [Methylorubrum extorquens]|uniref:Arginine--tRNA ligase n=1 Tax=Methylorubrum extorquens (strain PA1) TaxID=419610 RepID=SYR_METEP|nr:arginine--tRNA ligase [Methylorubrum extorquens]A9W7L3.1 RecName: Full=Arginine--tRNA ligase; AltName: Full=Arginyl-tRNA synthetase; Short=ArgRS [Methylorubrum extorquens PA1]ABY31782.1 arginyl-tRNA synthetase [Methylorubrum extorquens PA1]KQP87051.1 arginine--tRNA ligase [Methylobacterium sp. Leaf119]WIU38407.1 arginine--tRNA ligase [Methylorubrum extorquens]